MFSPYFTEEPTGTLLRELVATWNAQRPDIQVEIEAVPHSDRESKFRAEMLAGQGPDIVAVPPGSLDGYVQSGFLLDLEPLIAKHGGQAYKDQFTAVAQEGVTVDGKWYAIPWWGGVHALYYNTQLFDSAGLTPPRTWSEFLDAAKKLTTGRVYGYGMYGYRNEVSVRELLPWLWGNGTQLFDSAMTQATFDSPQGIEAFTFFTDLERKHRVVPPGVTALGYNEITVMFANGQVGMYQNGPWGRGKTLYDNPAMEGKFAVVPVPYPDAASHPVAVYVEVAHAITVQSKYPEQAFEFLEYYANAENMVRLALLMGFLPARRAAAEDPRVKGNEFLQPFVQLLPYSSVRPRHPRIQEINLVMADALQSALLGVRSPADALREAAREVTRIVREGQPGVK
ncbi:ABC transporter substrate-binding protein [Geochorda subterranea]|uniref:Sugar ABC transporter substrate-binding protein n=1 Tax=Geochorda subterranea TaxID=3109564 RepID=A0ABZ1BMD5_9FIRM|nr:sugar ABC transporter substrate-binding protein [Limnochorda sp. LNt]WRP13743.1 sugar ABC transporter substrate-binding protein [Limnochorda sp. LNt]